jgi:hypothetical protein
VATEARTGSKAPSQKSVGVNDKQAKRDPKSATKSDAKPEAKPETRPETKSTGRTDKPEPRPEPAADASGTGILRINSRPWSEVVIDGRAVGNTPQMNLRLPAGTHTVTLVNSQFGYTKTLKIKLKAGEVVTKIVDLN